MKILYIAVHYYNNDTNWRSEGDINSAFSKNDIETIKIDYKSTIAESSVEDLKNDIYKKSLDVDLIFLQRGRKLSPDLFSDIKIPIIFWSTEPINLKNDVDSLLSSNIFSWVFVHTYSCIDRIKEDFPHLKNKSSVIHNAIAEEKININLSKKRNFAIFNRHLSLRRRWWLWPSRKYIEKIRGKFGDMYFEDLRNSLIAINIHFSSKNLDDFETGVFEAMASGCVVLSEKLDSKTIQDLNMNDSIIQVNSRKELKKKIKYLKDNPKVIESFQEKSRLAIQKNTWYHRVKIFKNKFEELLLR